MRTTDLLRISSRQVLRQYRKNIGVILTIILGTAGLIIILTMGRSIEGNIANDLEIIGNATRLRVLFKHNLTTSHSIDRKEFRQETIDAIKTIPGVSHVSSVAANNRYVKVTYQNNSNYFEMISIDDSFWKVHGSSVRSGTLVTKEDLLHHRPVCVLGQRTAQELFGHFDVAGKFITVKNTLFQIIGVLDSTSMPDKARCIFFPITTARDRIDTLTLANKLYIRCHSWDDIESVMTKIPALVKRYQPNDDIEILLPKEILARVKAISLGVEIFVQLALTATFVLGGVGIWNIMMMAVRSRTREIGLKKAIGAEDHDILFQFLAESLMLSISATFIGFHLGWGGVTIAASILQNQPPKDLFWLSTGIAFSFSLVIGIVAGLAPAIKASRMEVVTALRYE